MFSIGSDLGSGQTLHHRVLLIDLYLHIKFGSNQKTFCGRTDGRTDGHGDRLY